MNAKSIGLVALLGGIALTGCVSPIHSSDPATRKQAMEQIADQKELFFIAMNIGVGIKDKWPELYQVTHLRAGEYHDDVRVMAAKKLTDPRYLLMCASWQDGDIYEDPASESGKFEYKGQTYYLSGDYKGNMIWKVASGDAVRQAAISTMKLSEVGKCLGGAYIKFLLPSSTHGTGSTYSSGGETSFVDYYGHIKPNNPLDAAIGSVVAKETSASEVSDFLIGASVNVSLVLNSYDAALRKLNGENSDAAKELFARLFLGGDCASQAKQNYGKAVIENPKKDWAWLVYQHINNPSTEIIKVALHYSDETSRAKILTRLTDYSLLNTIALELLHNHTIESWNSGRNDEIETVAQIANAISDKKMRGRLAVALICKINAYRSKCQSGWGMSWNEKDKTEAAKFTKAVDGLLSDDLLEEVIKEDDSKLSSLAYLFKDKKRPSTLGFTRIQNAVKGGKENEITKAWKDYGSAVYDDEMLKTLSVSSVYLRRPAFDQIKDEKVKTATLAAIKDALNKELKDCAAKQGELANFIGEIGNGEDLVAWIKGKSGQTELQNKETFAKMKGRMVVLRGEVKNIGQTMFSSKTYVSLRVAKVGMFDNIDVQFNVPDSLKPTVTAWMKGETHIMRGKLTSTGDLEDDAKCEDGEVVTEEKFNEAASLKEVMEDVKWQLKEIEEKKVPPVRTRPSRFGNAVKSAAGWIKSGVDDIKSSGDDLKAAGEMLQGLFN